MKKRRLKKKVKIGIFIFIVLITVGIVGGLSIYILNDDSTSKMNDNKIITTTKKKNDEKEKEQVYKANLTLVGDLLFEQPFYDSLNAGDNKDDYFSEVKRYFAIDDLSIGNMEVVIGNDNLNSSGTGYNFCAPESIGKLVTTLDFEVLSTANNHSYDRNVEGINSTIDFFKNNSDILTIGTYKSEEERKENKILEINNIKFGFVSYTLGTNIKVPAKYRNLIGFYRDPSTKTITEEYKNIMREEIKNIKDNSDVVIALVHWGKEFTNSPNNEQKELAKFLNEQGIDIIVGSHSHSIQPIEWIGDEYKTLVYYSLGNFVSADDDISRTGEKFDNAYQFGLLSTLSVTKNKDSISIDNIKAEAVINYFDKDMRNFRLIPFSNYTSEYETSHYRYNNNFNKSFIENMMNDVISSEFK